MPGKKKESEQEVTTKDLKRKSIKSYKENKDPDPENTPALEEDADVNEGVDSSQEPNQTSSNQTGRSREDEKSKDKRRKNLYPDIPVLDDPESEHTTSIGTFIYALRHLILALLFAFGFFLVKFFHQGTPEPDSFVPFNIDAVVSTLRQEFDFLPEKNFRVLKAALRGVNTDEEPRAPAVLLLVSSKGQESTSAKFATQLAKVLDKSYVPLSGTDLSVRRDAKKDIDDTIRTSVEGKEAKVFLVSELQQLDFDTTLIFHSFCDDQTAPYKRVVYVITVSCQSPDPSQKWDKIGMDCLSQAWPGIRNDMKDPLINRLTPSVMILHK